MCPWFVLLTECQWTICLPSLEFWQLILLVVDGNFFSAKTQRKVRFKNRGVSLSRAVDWNVNERFVCTSREFLQFIFLVLDGNFFYAKTQRKVRWQSRSVPFLCVLRKCLLYFCAFLTFSFGYVKIVLWKYCLLMWWDFVLVWEEL